MDVPKAKATQFDPRGRTGARSAPIAVDNPVIVTRPDPAEASTDPPGASSHVVYCGDEQEVREGFAIALRAMGLG